MVGRQFKLPAEGPPPAASSENRGSRALRPTSKDVVLHVSFKEKKQRTVDRDTVVGIVSCCYDDTILSSSLAYHMMSLSSVVQETSRMRYRRRRKDANYTSRLYSKLYRKTMLL